MHVAIRQDVEDVLSTELVDSQQPHVSADLG